MAKKYKGAKADYSVSRVGGFMVMEARGLFTPEAIEEMRSIIRTELMQAEAVKVLVDLRQTINLLGEGGWRRVLDASVSSTPLSAPVGILTAPTGFDALFTHCWEMAKRGRTRYAFSSLRGAEDWLGLDLGLPETRDFQQATAPDALG